MWTPECQTAFETLVKSVTSDSVIAVPDFSEEFILKTDASLIAIGCVLQQIQEGLKGGNWKVTDNIEVGWFS